MAKRTKKELKIVKVTFGNEDVSKILIKLAIDNINEQKGYEYLRLKDDKQ